MPTHDIQAMLMRIGLALAAGFFIACVPIAIRKGRFAPHTGRRVAAFSFAALSFAAFLAMGWHLWTRHVPRSPEPPAPIAYPLPPSNP